MVVNHPNAMNHWPEIRCQRGHVSHSSRQVNVSLGGPTPYADLTPIPARLARSFEMLVWDPDVYPIDGGPYCPAADAVSETIAALGVWAPDETTMVLGVLRPGDVFLDFGAQIGWFTLLAGSAGAHVTAFEADTENWRLLAENVALNGWRNRVDPHLVRVDRWTPPRPVDLVRLAKIDVEGAEDDVVRILWPSIDAGLVDHLLIEVTPQFGDFYPELIAGLVATGFEAYVLPPKQRPPIDLADPGTALAPYRVDQVPDLSQQVASWPQTMVWFKRADATW